ncbi:TetR/AcrR family transcriptional regulator [Nocardia huaxiensis]|uniref:TetR/AcrR family transcriptional regulator n=1 Tax=Nocardia huaxiensis TaxID=2755382 RepID=A0A7D6YYU2_9NOCA|nr:TetR/AcrR family transcriptional regulator [Nocardia huaxiensis]QLY27686.1 TetR/AcrR family transcriptional regulator [Nocardia huaxiensis]UFS98925.1 TetR/AcrR family transcriptional regulator [Nocardia huaxiensis]
MSGADTQAGRATRRAARAEQRRTALVLAAYDLVITRGFRTIGVDDIAAAAQVSHGTFYNYFENKRDILDAVIDHCFDLLRDYLLGPEGDDLPESLDEFCARYSRVIDRSFHLVDTEPGLVNFFLLEASSIDARVIDRCLLNARRYGEEAVAKVSYGIDRGYLDSSLDVDIAGEVLLSVLVSALLAALRGSSEGMTRDRVRAQLITFLATALGAES